jgi:hypothetical protein
MKLDRNIADNDGRGKYALILLRKLADYTPDRAFDKSLIMDAISLLDRAGGLAKSHSWRIVPDAVTPLANCQTNPEDKQPLIMNTPEAGKTSGAGSGPDERTVSSCRSRI